MRSRSRNPAATLGCHDNVTTHRKLAVPTLGRPRTAMDPFGLTPQGRYRGSSTQHPWTPIDRHGWAWAAHGSEDRLAARAQPTDQYDGALDTIDNHIGAAQWHWLTSPNTSNQRSGRRGRGFKSRHPDSCHPDSKNLVPGLPTAVLPQHGVWMLSHFRCTATALTLTAYSSAYEVNRVSRSLSSSASPGPSTATRRSASGSAAT